MGMGFAGAYAYVIDVAARKPHLRRHEPTANGVGQVRAEASGEATKA